MLTRQTNLSFDVYFLDVTIMLTLSTNQKPTSIIGKYDDLAKLSLLTEDMLLEHLKERYEKDLIYVN